MEHLLIKEAVHHVRRHSHRVKNAGNLSLFHQGKKIANKIRRAKNADSALALQSEYLELIKNEYKASSYSGTATQYFTNRNEGY